MVIKKNRMTYDDSNPRCQLFISNTSATHGLGNIQVAFITVIDDSTQMLKRYFGVWNWDDQKQSIAHIMDIGGKWPDAFQKAALPE
jgi:hypothetical protein